MRWRIVTKMAAIPDETRPTAPVVVVLGGPAVSGPKAGQPEEAPAENEESEDSDDEVAVHLGSLNTPGDVVQAQATVGLPDAQSEDEDEQQRQLQADEALAWSMARNTRLKRARQ